MHEPEVTEGQLPNPEGVVEDPALIPEAPVNPESEAVELDPAVAATYAALEERTS